MSNTILNLTVVQLQKALTIKEQIEGLQDELVSIMREGVPATREVAQRPEKKRRKMSDAGRARIAKAAKARWAKAKGPTMLKQSDKRRKFSAATRAKMRTAIKARWAKAKAAGRASL